VDLSQLLGNGSKDLIHTFPCLGADFLMFYASRSAVLKYMRIVESSLLLICLVTSNGNNDIGLCKFLNLNEGSSTSPAQNYLMSLKD
jgi:hypothetical protein